MNAVSTASSIEWKPNSLYVILEYREYREIKE